GGIQPVQRDGLKARITRQNKRVATVRQSKLQHVSKFRHVAKCIEVGVLLDPLEIDVPPRRGLQKQTDGSFAVSPSPRGITLGDRSRSQSIGTSRLVVKLGVAGMGLKRALESLERHARFFT